ncbi:deiodinase-like protein [Stappia indica]|uniref:deiodinase-like protein n=1 Tax=Stappia indica TaxID=538381 RepID=UPI001CD1FB05|nr:deiodinase-like protein [Stappia indica]MCA1298478.1 redoxin domain-containing protein [Stappia indica]
MTGYNYDAFSTDDYDFERAAGPEVGRKAPDFKLETSDGEIRNLLEFEGDFLVLELGSITCPLFQSRRGVMSPLSQEFPNVSSAVLYVREAHPGAGIQGHKTFADKRACARRLKEEDGETRLVYVDDFQGTAHKAYGSMPNAVYIINKNGCVVYKAEWNNPGATRSALKSLITGKPIRAKSYFRPARPATVHKTLRRAGKGAAGDFFKGLPFLFWTNVIKRNLRLVFNRPLPVSADTKC